MEEQFGWRVAKVCPAAIRIIDTIDLHFLRLARQEAIKAGRSSSEAELFSDTAKRELAAIWRSDLSLIISAAEMEILRENFGVSKDLIHYLPLMSHSDASQQQAWLDLEQRKHFVAIGNLRHAPNWDSLRYLKQILWPGIREALPEAELHIYGAYTDAKATALHQPREGFYIQGRASDAHAVIASARVLLAPLRFGAGLKGKLLEALESGTPSVTTGVGAEGMHGTLAWAGVIADQPEHFISSAVRLYQDRAMWRNCQQQGAIILRQVFDATRHQQALLQRLDDVTSQLSSRRHKNFIGAMLRHQHLKSTEYMSRWIETKQALAACLEESSRRLQDDAD
jgi:hypothetical protein